jgi:hypothetical protein
MRVRDEQPASQLQDLPAECCQNRAEPQVPAADLAGGRDPEAKPEQADVQQQRHHDGHGLAAGAPEITHAARHRGKRDRDDLAWSEHRDEPEGTQQALGKPGPLVPRHCPHTVHRVLDGIGHAAGAVQRQQDPDDQGEPGLAQPARDADPADDRIGHEGFCQARRQGRVALGEQVQNRISDQEQREHRREGVIGHQRRKVAGPIVAELLPGSDADGQPRVVLLNPVHGTREPRDSPADTAAWLLLLFAAHGAALSTRNPASHRALADYDSRASTSAAARSPDRTAPSI